MDFLVVLYEVFYHIWMLPRVDFYCPGVTAGLERVEVVAFVVEGEGSVQLPEVVGEGWNVEDGNAGGLERGEEGEEGGEEDRGGEEEKRRKRARARRSGRRRCLVA
jgi:hypothetical protein